MGQNMRFKRGYAASMSENMSNIFNETYHVRSMFWGVFLSLSVIVSIFIAMFLLHYVVNSEIMPIILSLPFVFVVMGFITRQFRYLENVVHFGSHYNISKNTKLNDWIINIFAAYAVLQDVGEYRKFHRTHHAYFGSEEDPCKIRFSNIGESAKGFSTVRSLLNNFRDCFPRYMINYYKDIGSNLITVTMFVCWYAMVLGFVSLIFGSEYAFFFLLIIMVCFFVLLPMVRYIAEISEHDYLTSNTELSCTFNNLSLLDFFLFHPGGDAYHLVHHLYPNIPWWLQGKAHRFLYEHDYSYRVAQHRTLLLQKVSLMEEAME